MKKLIALFAAAIISGSALFAENTLHIGAGFPISILSVDIDGSAEDFNQNAYDFTIDYTHVFEKGFTLKGGIDVGYVTTSDVKSAVKGDDLGGLDFAVNLGLGGSPLHNEKNDTFYSWNFRSSRSELLCYGR